MTDQDLVNVIDSLDAVEGTSLLSRLSTTRPFVSTCPTDEVRALLNMIEEEEHHRQLLVDLLDRLNATPGPRPAIASGGELNYMKLSTLVPYFLADKKRLIAQYENAAKLVAGRQPAADIIASITTSHRRHIEKLTAFKDKLAN